MRGARRAAARRTGATATRSTSSATPAPERYAKALEIAARGPEQRRPARHPHAAGDDRPDADRRGAASATRRSTGKPVLASWMGGAEVAAGEAILNQARHPDLPLPRHRRARLQRTCGGTADNLRGLYETPDAGRDPTTTPTAAARARRSSRRRAGPGRTLLDRGRVEAAARRLRHPDRRDARRARRGRGRRGRRARSAIPVVAQALLARRSRTRPTSAACSSTWPTPRRSRRAYRDDRGVGAPSGPAPGTSRA